MAEYGLFIGWGSPRAGRELAALQLFRESVDYWNGLKAAGEIEDLDLVLLNPHGGDLSGFALLKGERERLARMRMSPEFRRVVVRAGLCLDGVGVVEASVNDGVMDSMQQFTDAVGELV
jgi:hypothetical protein